MPFDLGSLQAILPEIILAATAAIVLLTDLWLGEEQKQVLVGLGIAGIAAAFLSIGTATGVQGEVLGQMIAADGFTNLFRVVFLGIALLVMFISPEYARQRSISQGEFYSLILFATVGLMFMANGADLLTLYLGLELSSIATYILAGMMRDDRKSNEASIKFLLNGAMASAVLLFGFSFVFGLAGTTNLSVIATKVGELASGSTSGLNMVALLGIVFSTAGFGFKIAAVPFHSWTPDTYQGAPTPITAFLSAGSKLGGFAMLMRVFLVALAPLTSSWTSIFAVLAVLTMTIGNITALLQSDIKRMMAYSSIAQLGYVLTGMAVATERSLTAMLFYLVAFAFVDMGVFSGITAINNAENTSELKEYVGLSRRAPLLAGAFVVFFLSLVGIPPTGGFFGKLMLYGAAVDVGLFYLAIAIALNSAISLGYYFGVVRNMYLSEAEAGSTNESAAEEEAEKGLSVGWGTGLAVAVCLVIVMALGLTPGVFLQGMQQAASIIIQ
jgi:NADH-quinone oxidoreductase subunit N